MDLICYDFLEEYFNINNIKNKKILEIGSFIVEGQEQLNLRKLLGKTNNFTGMDMRPGLGVDIVANSHKLPFKKNEFDLIINYNTLEHDDDPFKSMKEMQRCLSGDGVLLTSTPCYFYIHDYPSDYFRYTPAGIKLLGKSFKFSEIVCYGHQYFPQQVFGIFSNKDIKINMNIFVENYKKHVLPKIHMDVRNFLRYLKVDFMKKIYRVV